jgi:hypothetical protein
MYFKGTYGIISLMIAKTIERYEVCFYFCFVLFKVFYLIFFQIFKGKLYSGHSASVRAVGKRNYNNMMAGGSFYAFNSNSNNPFDLHYYLGMSSQGPAVNRFFNPPSFGGLQRAAPAAAAVITTTGSSHSTTTAATLQFLSDDPEKAEILIATTLAFLVGVIQVCVSK